MGRGRHVVRRGDACRARQGYFGGAGGGAAPGLGASPITVFKGQIETAGHFAQPATMAMGHSVMGGSR